MRYHLDLFSGIGGFSIAATMAGFKTVAFCEIEPYAQQILKEKFWAVAADAAESGPLPATLAGVHQSKAQAGTWYEQLERPCLHGDIFKLNGRDYAGVDLVTGGFPCQPFSCAGKRRGKEDDRHLWPEMLRVIAEARPAWVLGENVAGIITMELDGVLSDLENIGYTAWPLVIPAVAVDARHRRDRVWILASNTASRTGTKHEREHEWTQVTCSGGSNRLEPREDMADAKFAGQSGQGESFNAKHSTETGFEETTESRNGCFYSVWCPEPELGRVADGVPHRAHRLRGLGNAIVPQVAYEILKSIPL